MTKNLETIDLLKKYRGGDDMDVPIFPKAIDDMFFIVVNCDRLALPQPEIFPYVGGDGAQAEWHYDWYLEIDSSSKGVEFLLVKENDTKSAIEGSVGTINEAFLLIQTFLEKVVKYDQK